MENGWIKLHRKITEWEWFTDSKTLHVFLYLLMNANRNPRKWRGKMIDAGQIATGRKAISSATGISEQSVRTALSNLLSTNEITSEPTNRFTIITICNYSKYQMLECYGNQPINQQSTNNQPATNHKQEVKKVKNKKKIYGIGENVKLTDDEYQKILDRMGESVATDFIDRLSTWNKIETAKSHYLTILNWWRKEGSPVSKTGGLKLL